MLFLPAAIPDDKRDAVTRALEATFGATNFQDIQPLAGGLSTALVFRVTAGGRAYAMRVTTSTHAMHDLSRQLVSMGPASDEGLAPRIVYANEDDRILIAEFIEPRPFPDDAVVVVAEALRTLHALPAIPMFYDYLDAAGRFMQRFESARLVPEDRTRDLFRLYAEVSRVYPRDPADQVTSHNDLKPENILFDGTRVRLVDWEAATLNDRYVDLSIAANFFVEDEDAEAKYLHTYFGRQATDDEAARFILMRFVVSAFYAACFLPLAAADGASPDTAPTPLGFRGFHRALVARQIPIAEAGPKWQYGQLHLGEANRMISTVRFARALARVGVSSVKRHVDPDSV